MEAQRQASIPKAKFSDDQVEIAKKLLASLKTDGKKKATVVMEDDASDDSKGESIASATTESDSDMEKEYRDFLKFKQAQAKALEHSAKSDAEGQAKCS